MKSTSFQSSLFFFFFIFCTNYGLRCCPKDQLINKTLRSRNFIFFFSLDCSATRELSEQLIANCYHLPFFCSASFYWISTNFLQYQSSFSPLQLIFIEIISSKSSISRHLSLEIWNQPRWAAQSTIIITRDASRMCTNSQYIRHIHSYWYANTAVSAINTVPLLLTWLLRCWIA